MSISRPCSSHACTRAGLPMSAASLDTAAANPTTLAHPPCCGTPLHFHRSAVCPPATSCTVPQRHHHLSWPQSCPANSAIKSAQIMLHPKAFADTGNPNCSTTRHHANCSCSPPMPCSCQSCPAIQLAAAAGASGTPRIQLCH